MNDVSVIDRFLEVFGLYIDTGFGLLGGSSTGHVEVLVSPVAPTPRKNARARSRLLDEHRRRRGDPAVGGSTRQPIMTAYRQQALACAAALLRVGVHWLDLRVQRAASASRHALQRTVEAAHGGPGAAASQLRVLHAPPVQLVECPCAP